MWQGWRGAGTTPHKSTHAKYHNSIIILQGSRLVTDSPHSDSIAHDDVIKWKQFPRYWSFVRGIHRSQVNFPHKGQWRGALKFCLICAQINSWVNNCEAGDLRRHPTYCDVIVMVTRIYDQMASSAKRTSSRKLRYLFCQYDLSTLKRWSYHGSFVSESFLLTRTSYWTRFRISSNHFYYNWTHTGAFMFYTSCNVYWIGS